MAARSKACAPTAAATRSSSCWKKAAKSLASGGELVSRDTSRVGAAASCGSTGRPAAALAPEERLSRLAAWVVAAQRAGAAYGLRCPGGHLEPGEGEAHRRVAWRPWRCGAELPNLPSGPGWRLPRWPGWSRLPREARDTLFLLGVIAWTVLPHLSHLPPGALR